MVTMELQHQVPVKLLVSRVRRRTVRTTDQIERWPIIPVVWKDRAEVQLWGLEGSIVHLVYLA